MCPQHSECINTQGSFYCRCHQGFTMYSGKQHGYVGLYRLAQLPILDSNHEPQTMIANSCEGEGTQKPINLFTLMRVLSFQHIEAKRFSLQGSASTTKSADWVREASASGDAQISPVHFSANVRRGETFGWKAFDAWIPRILHVFTIAFYVFLQVQQTGVRVQRSQRMRPKQGNVRSAQRMCEHPRKSQVHRANHLSGRRLLQKADENRRIRLSAGYDEHLPPPRLQTHHDRQVVVACLQTVAAEHILPLRFDHVPAAHPGKALPNQVSRATPTATVQLLDRARRPERVQLAADVDVPAARVPDA